uniref:Plectin-like n=1 Tax=Petromyzon marinus TaxID=7757 RepID=A0AAJ7TH15_PETMA|nr:plectin-like [Petromyzon marinus]
MDPFSSSSSSGELSPSTPGAPRSRSGRFGESPLSPGLSPRSPRSPGFSPADRAVAFLADERERVQKKTFTKWVNKHLQKAKRHVDDLYVDLRDGHNLLCLLEVLSGEKLPREKGKMLVHMLQNVNIALEFLRKKQVKLVNIRSEEITQGSPKLTLGLIWTLILHFQVSEIEVGDQHRDLTAQSRLMVWVRNTIDGYPSLKCDNFSTSWRDGKVFNAIIHKHRPDLINIEKVYVSSNVENLERAFVTAEQNFEVIRLLDPEDVDVPNPDEKSIVTYVSSLYDAFPRIPAGGISLQEVDAHWDEYQRLVRELLAWIEQQGARIRQSSRPTDEAQAKAVLAWFAELRDTEMVAKAEEKSQIYALYKALEVWISFGRIRVPPDLTPEHVEEEWSKLTLLLDDQERSVLSGNQRSDQEARAESEQRLRSLEELLAKVAQTQAEVDGAEWGRDEPGVTMALAGVQALEHRVLLLGTAVDDASRARDALLVEHQAEYDRQLQRVNVAYANLKHSWEARALHLRALLALAASARGPLEWMARAEAAELSHDWSRTDGLPAKGDSLRALRAELLRVEEEVAGICESGQSLIESGHPAQDSITAITGELKGRLLWILTLAGCAEMHLHEHTACLQFFEGVRDAEAAVAEVRRGLATRCSWGRAADRRQLETIFEEIQEEEDTVVADLRSRAQALAAAASGVANVGAVPGVQAVPLRVLCDYPAGGEPSLAQGARCSLLGPAPRQGWCRVSGAAAPTEAPAVCLLAEPPNNDALEAASRLLELLSAVSIERGSTVQGLLAWRSLLEVVEETRVVTDEELLALQEEELSSVVETLGQLLASFDAAQSQGSALGWRDAAAGEAEGAAARYRAAIQERRRAGEAGARETEVPPASAAAAAAAAASAAARESERVASLLREIAARLERCRGTMERGVEAAVDGAPRLPDHLRARLAEHKVTEEELASVGEELPRVAVAIEAAATAASAASPAASPGRRADAALGAELGRVQREHQLLLHALSLYGSRLRSLEVLLKNIQNAEEATSSLEGRLGEGGFAPCEALALEELRSRLADLQRDAARGGAAFQSLRSSLSESEAASERLLGTLAGPGAGEPAARACRDAVDALLGRWADATQRLAAR